MNKRITVGVLTVALGLTACGGGGEGGGDPAGDNTTFRVGHGGSPGDVLDQSLDVFAEEVGSGTDGRYTIEIYGASQLGNERDLVEGVSLGTIDMTLVTNAPIGNFVPEALFYDLPGLYVDLDHVHAVAESPIVTETLSGALQEENLHLLAVTDGGFRNITNSRHEVKTVDDLSGLKMRVQESPIISATYSAVPGVTAVPIPIGDLYSSMEQGVVDAQENPAILVRDFKFNEVQRYMTLTSHSYFPRHLLMNEDTWQSISAEDQEVFLEASAELETYANDYYETETDQALTELQEAGMTVTEPDASFTEDFYALMQSEVYPEFYDDIGGGDAARGEELVDQIRSLAD